MAKGDTANAAAALADINLFPSIPDRLQQAMLNTMFLGRLLTNVDGWARRSSSRPPAAPTC